MIIKLHEQLGNRWCRIAAGLPGRTDNEIKNHWHTHLKKRLKNNQVPSTSSKRRQKATVEANQNNPPKFDSLPPNSPKVLNLNGFKGPPSPCLNREVYQNQPTEENNFSNEEIKSLSEQLFPMESLYSSEGDYGAILSYPEFMVLTSHRELLEDTYTWYDGCFGLWD